MHYFLFTGIDLLSSLLVLLPILCLFLYLRGRRQTALFALSTLYLCAVFSIAGIPSIHSLTFEPSFNWIPLLDIIHAPLSYLKNTILNILLFLPLGILLPVFLGDTCSLKKAAAWGFGLSLFIELLQLFTMRLTDVDDLIANTLGAIIGYCLTCSFWAAHPTRSRSQYWNWKKHCYEPLLPILIAFLVMFTIQPLISNAIWDIVLETPLWKWIR